MKKSIQLIILGLALCCATLAQAEKPVFLITPVTKAPSTIYAGQTVTTTYTVTNTAPYALDGNGVVELPTGVTQAGGSCNMPFNLASGASCTLALQIVADTLEGDVRGGPKVCNTLANPIYCSVPSSDNALHITKSNNPPPNTSFTISGTITGLTASGLVLRNNGGDDLTVHSGTTSFKFATPVAYGGGYALTVATQPTGLTCTVSNGTGTNVTANVSDVQVVCTLAVGDALGGGVVYRIDSGTVYILSLIDVGAAAWGPYYNVSTSADNTFDSSDNTYSALAGTNFPAAAACRNYDTGDGAGNWYLPARNEWELVISDISAINAQSSTTGFTQFAAGSAYWSSTQSDYNDAFSLDFSSATHGRDFTSGKDRSLRVRCVRALTI